MIIHRLCIKLTYICIGTHIYYVADCPTYREKEGDVMKEKVVYSLDLTVKNNTQTGFKCRHEDVGCNEVAKAVKAMLDSLRRKAKAKGRNWDYCVYGVVSNVSVSRCRLSSYHAHLLLYGSPCCTIAQEAKSYWTSRCYGNSIQQSLKRCKDYGKVDYVLKHAKAAKDLGLQKREFVQYVGDVEVGSKKEVFELFEKVLPKASVEYSYDSWKERLLDTL